LNIKNQITSGGFFFDSPCTLYTEWYINIMRLLSRRQWISLSYMACDSRHVCRPT